MIQLLTIFALSLFIPAFLLISLVLTRHPSMRDWLVSTATSISLFLFFVLIGRWDWLGYFLRYMWLVLLVVAVFVAYRRQQTAPQDMPEKSRFQQLSMYAGLVFALGMLAFAGRGLFFSAEPVTLESPLRDGRFYVGQGGNSPLLNYHNTYEPQQFALDVVELDSFGKRASGFYPTELDAYEIFGTPLYSPCDGTIETAVDGLPDMIPPNADRDNLAGNHVVIVCETAKVMIAHIQEGTVAVEENDAVTAGQAIGAVGNSGNTTEPHLHIHAVAPDDDIWRGVGIPMLINGDFPTRNRFLNP